MFTTANELITKHDLTISTQKIKLMPFKGQEPGRSKTAIENKITEQVYSFNYLGNLISYEKEVDTDNKLNNYLKITGIINNIPHHTKL